MITFHSCIPFVIFFSSFNWITFDLAIFKFAVLWINRNSLIEKNYLSVQHKGSCVPPKVYALTTLHADLGRFSL